ncbi:hypothetical protein GCM10025867_11630 [Frondihabitans sucicola]|uniref:Uncharacterized protein n=1 Tax=Frondihabitans sucicola TaxID=1268041 RepID=A0ABM8GKL7_9MICO|nr:hypothetical protein [Frondihabitans sucicola]BDZ48922.1 hypothetical protein GCM10025867_11630 [Frondihabitans sucicola]
MASYRITLSVGRLAPAVAPDAVLPAAAAGAATLTTVEARDVAVVRGEARITVRYTADDDHTAARVADAVAAATSPLAEVTRAALTRRDGGRWVRLPY